MLRLVERVWSKNLFLNSCWKDMQTKAKDAANDTVPIGETKWGQRCNECMELLTRLCHSLPDTCDEMWNDQPISKGTSQEIFVTVYWCRMILLDKLYDYATYGGEQAPEDDWGDIEQRCYNGGYDAIILSMCPMKISPERHPTVLLPLVKRQVFKEVLKEVSCP